jgi:FlaA1/EpsC-like NDP-sugar epimerase
MKAKILNKTTPRWIVFMVDITLCLLSVVLAYELRFNFSIPPSELSPLPYILAYVLGVKAIGFIFSKTYNSIVRFTSSFDAQRIFLVLTFDTAFLVLTNVITYYTHHRFYIPFSIIIIDYLAAVFLLISFRIIIKVLYFEFKNTGKEKTKVIIIGAGESGIITKRTLDRDAGTKYKVIGFIDEDEKKVGKKIESVKIYSGDYLVELLQKHNISMIIIALQNIASIEKQKIVDLAFRYNTKVLTVPPINNWINGQLSFKQIKKIKIEDLLERDPIKLDTDKIKNQITNKVVLVTGGAGSIGSELVSQIYKFNPKKIIVLDCAETPLYEIEMAMVDKNVVNIEFVIGNICNVERMENLFNTFKPDVVYHAAAYKHVPLMENNPSEAVFTNVLGTKIIADLSVKYNVKEFVMVSTDKAVNPTNVMGASKRIAEMYIQSLNKSTQTNFITTRFGNVLGSNGSVIPRFKQQIEKGGPITITHPEITRYFMTIPEACQLVLEAGSMGKGGEIFIFDMGKSVKIIDLAKKIIRLSGLELEKDIQIVYTGLRPGEKLYEELLNDKENTTPTHHPQIMIAKVAESDYEKVSKLTDELISLFNKQQNNEIVRKMKQIVPEYISNNSVYNSLDVVE